MIKKKKTIYIILKKKKIDSLAYQRIRRFAGHMYNSKFPTEILILKQIDLCLRFIFQVRNITRETYVYSNGLIGHRIRYIYIDVYI